MPRKTKEQTEKLEKEQAKKTTAKKSTTKKTTTKKTATKSVASKKSGATKKAETKAVTSVKKATSKKSTTSTKKTSTSVKRASSKKTTQTTKKTGASSKKANAKSTRKKAIPIVEYYDLPYRYNQTIVKLLAQTPKNLFVYWDISDEDRENYKKTYGENFFEETNPVLIIHNNTLNYSFEVEINDFANSWYIHVNDSKCDYSIELGRRPIPSVSHIEPQYIYVSSSNDIESPNDKILFNTDEHNVYFRNVKTNVTSTRSISFIRNMGRIYNIYDLYQTIYKDEVLEDLSSSTFK